MWYHLNWNGSKGDYITELRESDREYLDVDGPRLCLAPTAYQCAMAISDEGRFYIYEVDVENPVPANEDHSNVADFEKTHEHRITPEVLSSSGGSIPIKRIGFVDITGALLQKLKRVFGQSGFMLDAAGEKEHIWHIDGEEWRPEFESHTLRKILREASNH